MRHSQRTQLHQLYYLHTFVVVLFIHLIKTDPNESSTTSRVKQGFSNMLGGLSETFAPKDPRKESDPRIVLHKSDQHIFDKAKVMQSIHFIIQIKTKLFF